MIAVMTEKNESKWGAACHIKEYSKAHHSWEDSGKYD